MGSLADTSHSSTPAYQSPLRHHRRNPSQHREVKETLNARSAYTNNQADGRAEHHINQYIIKDEIGRGSFGAVHLAVDQYGTEYVSMFPCFSDVSGMCQGLDKYIARSNGAVKEFSKSRLRKRAQSNILRRPHGAKRPGHLAAGSGLNAPLHRHSASDIHNGQEQGNPLFLIKEEIAIMKKLNHPNLVSLIEVLDDPEEDSLYMVLEMCKKGVVMKVGLNEQADPYDPEKCRHWFRDMVLGIEYLHAQGVVHRDIKPDNLLLTDDDILKIVDFGVSEMFEKASDMMTAKSAGSPAFLPPELCVTRHGDVSGKAADIWSMGVSLYCLRFGRIPFERSGVLELYDSIRNDHPEIEGEPEFCDLMQRMLEKDPKKRIKMAAIREHSWVTKHGSDPLLSLEENTADMVEPPSQIEVNHAITAKMANLLVMMKAVQKFKTLVETRRPTALSKALGKGLRAKPNLGAEGESGFTLHRSRSVTSDDRGHPETVLATEGVHLKGAAADTIVGNSAERQSTTRDVKEERNANDIPEFIPPGLHKEDSGDKGHAQDPLEEEPLFLGIGAGGDFLEAPPQDIVAESPTAADFNIYDVAYQEEVNRIRAAQGFTATVYLTRRVDSKKEYKADENMVEAPQSNETAGGATAGFKHLLDKAREKKVEPEHKAGGGNRFSEIAAKAIENTKVFGRGLSERGGGVVDNMLAKAVEKRNEQKEMKEVKEGNRL
ncbi:related to calcium/calmodulin dependent protein kinase C [Rhynchosporium graminicola]|uniref:Related to calcium/calmodulin dependent protein kinase C n=1 Tax=Rhynchosporium graminicola TaxID=2792576 RepID=A0A1E1L4B0_9HELO|nr:related to calcium/calmodulin dependent protein kinase C [Rhynchosporium commune]